MPPGISSAKQRRSSAIGEASGRRWRSLTEVKPRLHTVNYAESVRTEAEQIFRQYGRDHRLSFCDAISFVVVTDLLDHMPCLAFDEDFRGLGLTVIP
jgi:predicted nucleic acid-binding protein